MTWSYKNYVKGLLYSISKLLVGFTLKISLFLSKNVSMHFAVWSIACIFCMIFRTHVNRIYCTSNILKNETFVTERKES